jgi:5-methylcytosine-specific restriction protein A
MPFKPKKKQTQQYSQGRVGNFYQSTVWRKLRNWHIKLNPLCEMCKLKNYYTFGEVVDHINPISKGGAMLDPENLQTLCKTCHGIKTAKENK